MLWWTLRQLKSSDPDLQIKAAQSLAAGRQKKAVPSLVEALGEENPKVRLAVVEALGTIGHPGSAEPLVAALSNVSKIAKSGAAEEYESIAKAIVSLGSAAASPLVKALASEDKETRRWAASALGAIKDPQAVDALVQKLEDSRSEVRRAAALALGDIGDLAATEGLIKSLGNRDWETRRAAAEALGKMKPQKAVDALIKAAGDQSEPVQIAAIVALGKIGSLPAAAYLRSAMSGARKAVCDAADAALKSINILPANGCERAELAVVKADFEAAFREGTAAVPSLVRALSYKDPRMRLKAVETLARIQSPDTLQPLLDALKDHDSAVQQAAARAVVPMGAAAIPGLEASLSSYDASVVRLASEALGQIGSPGSISALLDLIAANSRIPGEYPDLFDAMNAGADALGRILSTSAAKADRTDLERISELPEEIRLLGPSPKTADCSSLRNQAAEELRRRN